MSAVRSGESQLHSDGETRCIGLGLSLEMEVPVGT